MTLWTRVVRSILLIGLAAAGVFWIFGNERTNVWRTPPQESRPNTEAVPASRNLTRTVAEQISNEMLEKNANGLQQMGDELAAVANPAEILERLMTATQEFETALPAVSDQELTINFADTPDAKKTYVLALNGILGRLALGAPSILDAFQAIMFEANGAPVALLAERHEGAIAALKRLPVPLSLVPLHKQEILLLERTMVMLTALASYPADPLRAYVAFQAYPKLVDEAKGLQNQFLAYFETERIAF